MSRFKLGLPSARQALNELGIYEPQEAWEALIVRGYMPESFADNPQRRFQQDYNALTLKEAKSEFLRGFPYSMRMITSIADDVDCLLTAESLALDIAYRLYKIQKWLMEICPDHEPIHDEPLAKYYAKCIPSIVWRDGVVWERPFNGRRSDISDTHCFAWARRILNLSSIAGVTADQSRTLSREERWNRGVLTVESASPRKNQATTIRVLTEGSFSRTEKPATDTLVPFLQERHPDGFPLSTLPNPFEPLSAMVKTTFVRSFEIVPSGKKTLGIIISF